MKILKVIKYYECRNLLYCSIDMHMRMKFIDRLKFLIYGDECIFRFDEIESFKKFRKENDYDGE